MKLYNAMIAILLIAVMAYAVTDGIRNENLLRGIRDAKAIQEREAANVLLIGKAQDYATPLIHSVQALSTENGALLERELLAAKTVNGLLEESNRLKVALKEAVTKLKELNEANNKALEEIDQLEFKVQTLQSALDAITKAKEAQMPPKELSIPTPQVPVVPPAPKVKTIPKKVA